MYTRYYKPGPLGKTFCKSPRTNSYVAIIRFSGDAHFVFSKLCVMGICASRSELASLKTELELASLKTELRALRVRVGVV